MSVSDWIDVILEAAAARMARGKPLFLAQIPPLLKSRGFDIDKILQGRSLRELIAVEGVEKLRIVRDPKHELVWGVIPQSAPTDIDLDSLFAREQFTTTLPAGPTGPRFKKWFWTAFIKPIAPGDKRYLLADRFNDIPESVTPPTGAMIVEPTDVLNPEPAVAVEGHDVISLINNWAERNSAPLNEYYLGTAVPHRSETNRKQFPELATLEVDDLKRIMVPMDIVLKLLRR